MEKPRYWKNRKAAGDRCGFTIIEIIIVVVILSIAALIAVPMLGTTADTQVRTAANMIAADMEYARSLSISRQQNHSVVFDTANNTYGVYEEAQALLLPQGTAVDNPLNSAKKLSIDFGADARLNKVDLTVANFDGAADQAVTFDYLGNPYSGIGTATPLTTGTITLAAGGFQMDVLVEPVTGYITIQ